MYLCKFGQNQLTGSEDNARKRKIGHQRDLHQKQYIPPPSWLGDINKDSYSYENG